MHNAVTKRKNLIVSVVFAGTILAGCTSTAPLSQTASSTQEGESKTLTEEAPSMMQEQESSTIEGKSMVAGAPKQIAFVSEASAQAEAKIGKAVYFFKASWCPTCQAAQKDFDATISTLPQGVTLITVDYDKEKALKAKYGITTQHTFVQIDSDGAVVSKWNGGGSTELAKNIK